MQHLDVIHTAGSIEQRPVLDVEFRDREELEKRLRLRRQQEPTYGRRGAHDEGKVAADIGAKRDDGPLPEFD